MVKETIYTFAFILFAISMAAIANYGFQSSKWAYIIFPDKSKEALSESLPHIDYFADSNKNYNSVTAYISNDYDRSSLIEKGAILLDPKGVPLCLNGE